SAYCLLLSAITRSVVYFLTVLSSLEYLLDPNLDNHKDICMERTTDIHVSLPDTLLESLDRVARERRVRRAQLVREAVAGFLSRVEAERVQREMADYVEALADHSEDFVAETDAHTVHRLLRETKW
ncbi:MAG: hypothetical protein DMG10_00120, partial [Acidobacteria bacterium]